MSDTIEFGVHNRKPPSPAIGELIDYLRVGSQPPFANEQVRRRKTDFGSPHPSHHLATTLDSPVATGTAREPNVKPLDCTRELARIAEKRLQTSGAGLLRTYAV